MDATRIVLVHDWLTGMRGGEKCLEPICRRFPNAQLFTLLHLRGRVSPAIERLSPRTSLLQQLPGAGRYYRWLLPVMPLAANWRIPSCELVLSFSHCVAKSARAPEGVPHVCYCFTPMRYAWHLRDSYFGENKSNQLKRRAIEAVLARLRDWDRRTASRVTHFIAISRTIQKRIRECWGRDSEVIYPPVDTDFFTPSSAPREDFYLCVSALAPYKRLDLAIEACNRLKRRLIVIGSGQDEKRLRRLAGATIEMLGWQSDEAIRDHYRRCRALLFPGEEDFGIVPVEAQACGAPVIALGRGGAAETVIDSNRAPSTGLLFEEQSINCLIGAIESFERCHERFDPIAMRQHALSFRTQRYETELASYLEQALGRPLVGPSADEREASHQLPQELHSEKSKPVAAKPRGLATTGLNGVISRSIS
jgi:glycosyltransferase involved in cell wall biosynthesis